MRTATFLFLLGAIAAQAEPARIAVDFGRKGPEVPKTLYGIFFEDVNRAGEGGLYPEMIANRGFDWRTKDLEGWVRDTRGGGMARLTRQNGRPVHEATATHLRIETFGAGTGTGVKNLGYGGISVKAGAKYDLSLYLRGRDGYAGNVRIVLEDAKGGLLCEHRIANANLGRDEWTRHEAVFTVPRTEEKATLSVLMDRAGVLEVEQVSLFPQDTFRGRRNGLRKDLAELLRDLRPAVLRFPGGCITEGNDWPEWYDWRLSVGDGTLESRACIWNRWGYWQSLGLGYYEFFLLCEDIGAEPLPVMNAGLTCQFADPCDIVPLEAMGYFVTNFCELVEFANGDVSTKWGAIRAKMGHPKPFGLKYVGIGNENWGKDFLDRYEVIAKELRRRYPEIRLVSTAGANPEGPDFDLAWTRLDTDLADFIDEHYYKPADWILSAARRYDGYSRAANRPKVYVGEYACHLPGKVNSLYAALCEAALMTGFERNCEQVQMSSYAPLFGKVGDSVWKPNLIWFDNSRAFVTPSYHVQRIFSCNRPDEIVPSSATGADFHQVCGLDRAKGELVVKCVNTANVPRDLEVDLGKPFPAGKVSVTMLAGAPDAVNDLDHPTRCAPVESTLDFAGGRTLRANLPATALMVLRIHH